MKNLIIILLCLGVSTIMAQSNIKQIEGFRAVSLSGNVDVELIPGSKDGYEVIKDHEDLKIDVNNRVLKISLNKVGRVFKDDKAATVKVYYQDLSEIKVNAGAQVSHDGVCKFDEMKMRFGSGAYGKFEIEGERLDVSTGEGAVLKLAGKVISLKAQSSTGAELKATSLESDETSVDANTGGVANVSAKKSIYARASLGGSVSYDGNPEKYDVKESLGGSVHRH